MGRMEEFQMKQPTLKLLQNILDIFEHHNTVVKKRIVYI